MGYQKAILSTLMLYKWDNSIFDYFRVPNGMNKEVAQNNILIETDEMSVIYPNPDTLKLSIKLWTDKNFQVWEELWKTLSYDYNPIHNYDRKEEGVVVYTGTENNDNERHQNETDRRNISSTSNTDTTESDKVAAFNNGLADSTSSTTNVDLISSQNDDRTNDTDQSETLNYERNLKDETYNHAYGNIGVMSTQELINQQREVVQFNLYNYICDDYKKHFCIMV